jgi:spermidine synthase
VVQSELATLFSIFPHASIWANDDEGFGYDTVVLGYAEPLSIDLAMLQDRLDHPAHDRIRTALDVLGFESALDLLATYTGRAIELQAWLAEAEINRDRNLRLQYLAGLELESVSGAGTYEEMLAYRSFPYDVFQGSTETRIRLQQKMGMDWFSP